MTSDWTLETDTQLTPRLCRTCSDTQWSIIQKIYEDNDAALDIFTKHGILPTALNCPSCGKELNLSGRTWRCSRSYVIPKTKRRKFCGYSISHFKGTFLHGSHLQPWQILGFVLLWLDKDFKHYKAVRNLEIDKRTSVEWRKFCSEVTTHWLDGQDDQIYTQNAQNFKLKLYTQRPGMKKKYMQQYLGRYLFLMHYKHEALHHFLLRAATLFPHQSSTQSEDPHISPTHSKVSGERAAET